MLGDQLESTELLANIFNTFLAGLTADFVPLPKVIPGSFFPVPEHLLVDTRMVYKALRGIKSNKSGGPDPIPGKVWKEFAFELSPVITNIYNASMVQGYALKIIFGRVDYTEALVLAGLESLSDRRVGACKRFMATARQMSPLKNIIPSPAAIESHYSIRVQLPRRQHGHTRRINDFVTYKFQ